MEITNEVRKVFGVELLDEAWEKVILKGNQYSIDSELYFDGDVIRKHIVKGENLYREKSFFEKTKEREFLLPKTSKGKIQPLTTSNFERRTPIKVDFNYDTHSGLSVYNRDNNLTICSTFMEGVSIDNFTELTTYLKKYVSDTKPMHLIELDRINTARRRNIKYKSGDFFRFRLDRNTYGYGRLLLDIHLLKKKAVINSEHMLNTYMTRPVLVGIYPITSVTSDPALDELNELPFLPTEVIMDNALFYGDYEIIGSTELNDEQFDFPINFSRSISFGNPNFYLQWGLINIKINPKDVPSEIQQSHASNYGISGAISYIKNDILKAEKSNGDFSWVFIDIHSFKFDLRSPTNVDLKRKIFEISGLDPNRSYTDNCKLINQVSIAEIFKEI